ncbi:MAG: hypothetical protein AAFP93_02300 [Bacteroidota bacterium]
MTGKGWMLLRHHLQLHTVPVELPVATVAPRGRILHPQLCTLLAQHFQDVRVSKVLVSKLCLHTHPKPIERQHP